MGELFERFRETGNGKIPDSKFVFQLIPNGIATYAVERKRAGFFKTDIHYELTHTLPITKETKIDLRTIGNSGSGMCGVRTGQDIEDYHVYEKVRTFAQLIQEQIDRAAILHSSS